MDADVKTWNQLWPISSNERFEMPSKMSAAIIKMLVVVRQNIEPVFTCVTSALI